MADAPGSTEASPQPTATPRQRLEEARAAAAAVDPGEAAVSARARTSSLPEEEMKDWPALCRRVVEGEGPGAQPVLASVHGTSASPSVFRLEAVGFSGSRHVIVVTASGDALPSDPELRPAFASSILDALVVSAGSATGAEQLSLRPELGATWVASV